MSNRGASRHGTDASGLWERDDDGLPAYIWDLTRLPPGPSPPWPHVLGTGLIQMQADQHGILRLTGGPAAARVMTPASGPGCLSALRVEMTLDGAPLRLLPMAAPAAWQPRLRYGCGYVDYDLAVEAAGLPGPLAVRLALTACPAQPFVLVEIRLRPESSWPTSGAVVLSVASDVAAPGGAAAGFAREGVAMLGLGDSGLDVFLAGRDGWSSHVRSGRLELQRTLELRPGEALALPLLLGLSEACSRQWLTAQFASLDTAALRARQRQALDAAPVAAPELWLREELTWCRAALLAYQAPDDLIQRPIVHPAAGRAPVRTAHRLALCPWLQRHSPDLVRATLLAVASRQGPQGQLPEALGGTLPGAAPDPARDRSDTEAAFLWACACWLSSPEHHDILAAPCPAGPSPGPTLAERLERAVRWVRDGIGLGPHGLVRLLAGDALGALDDAGRAGAGESVLTTAQVVAALRGLADALRSTPWGDLGERLDALQRRLAPALEDAFHEGAFRRGYNDAGEAFGDPSAGPVFADVQAWVVLARGGTLSQRRSALDAVLSACGDGPITTLTRPFPASWPRGLCQAAILPGDGANAGIGLMEAAWFLQAMALEGRHAEALARFHCLALRPRAAVAGRPGFPMICRAARCQGPAAQSHAWWPAEEPAVDAQPEAVALAWEEAVLRSLLTPLPPPP